MLTIDAIAWAGDEETLAARLGVHRNAVAQWADSVPALRQFQLALLSRGALRPDADLCPQWEAVLLDELRERAEDADWLAVDE